MNNKKNMEIRTYSQMNKELKNLLRLTEQPMAIYAAARIEELEGQLRTEREKRRGIGKTHGEAGELRDKGAKGMTTKEYLMQYRQIEKEINWLLEDRARWAALAGKMTPSLSGMPGGAGGGDRLGETVAKIVDLEREIDAKVDELVDHHRKIGEAISQIPDIKEREVLRRRYIQGQNWEKIAERMGINPRWVYRLHGRAIFSLQAIVSQY